MITVLVDKDDQQSVERCRRGDTRAFGPLVERYQIVVFNAIVHMLGNRAEAADLTRRVFVTAYRNLEEADVSQSFFTYVARIVIEEAGKVLGDRPAPADSATTEPEASRLVRRLAPEDRIAIILRHFLRCSYEEAAEILGTSPGAFQTRLFTARRRLADAMRAGAGR